VLAEDHPYVRNAQEEFLPASGAYCGARYRCTGHLLLVPLCRGFAAEIGGLAFGLAAIVMPRGRS
jgi:hypothetical protein